ncbi:MAG: nucleotide pyrophosphohydrolase [Candidatus Heimdallarchaeota archaeon]|nr:MAG: nucleotide pyrophosphohydrolase [Candidatus Heimdallarchaeota archaeon]
MTCPDSLKELKLLVADFITRRDWKKYHTVKNLSMSISIEAAEIMELFQWLTNEEATKQIQTDPNLKTKLEDELADVLIYCLSLGYHAKIDLNKIIREKLNRNEQRFPIEVVSGRLGPYTPSSSRKGD